MPTDFNWFNRISLAAAGILGAAGVAAAAAASHSGHERVLGALALVALTHAPALVALTVFSGTGWLFRGAMSSIGLGALLFSGDLAARYFIGSAIFPMSAPLGGLLLIGGWLLVTLAALIPRSSKI
jgi:uncharacterized membrane protein YgdD (TMEM256/DUF423 family)